MIDPLLFLLAAVTLLIVPGPTNMLLAAAGAASGWRRALPLLVAVLVAYLTAVGLIRLVLGPVVAAAPVVATILKVMVATYLAMIAVRMWLRAGPEASAAPTTRQIFVATLLNPKSLIFAIGILPAGGWELSWYMLTFALACLACGSAWILIGQGIGLAARGRDERIVSRVAALALGGFAGMILASAFA
jgi:threonine/homoserine/homoserine lactone efflux protein